MKTFNDLWYKIYEELDEFNLLDHVFKIYYIRTNEGSCDISYICKNCNTSFYRIDTAVHSYKRYISVYNVKNGKDYNTLLTLDKPLKNNFIACKELLIKSIIE